MQSPHAAAARSGRWIAGTLAIFWGIYLAALHPWLMRWGASPAETAASLPGDVSGQRYFTRAITVRAPASRVWPWLVQIGQDRGGFYSYDWLENLAGADIHNAGRIHPEWQRRAVGDTVRLARPDLLGGSLAHSSETRIVLVDRERAIADTPGRFVLQPTGGGATRLLVREAFEAQGPVLLRWLVWDPLHFVMVQRMMRGIKERAEERPLVPRWLSALALLGWGLAGVSVVVALFADPARRGWLLLALLPALAVLLTTGDSRSALVAFVALGTTAVGRFLFGRRWWGFLLLVVAGVALLLLLAPDAFAALGLTFAAILSSLAAGRPRLRRHLDTAVG